MHFFKLRLCIGKVLHTRMQSGVMTIGIVMLAIVPTYTVTIVGAGGALGRELVQQCRDRDWTPIALCRIVQPIPHPVRSGWLTPSANAPQLPPMANIDIRSVSDPPAHSDAIVFALSGKPFSRDTSSDAVRSVLDATNCSKIAFVSAHGVAGDASSDANVGITIMRSVYLQSTYEEKRAQERMLMDRVGTTRCIWRPRVLSYDTIPFNPIATPRSVLARHILDWCGFAPDDGSIRQM